MERLLGYTVGTVPHEDGKAMQIRLLFSDGDGIQEGVYQGAEADEVIDTLRDLLSEFESKALQLDLEEGNHV